MNRTKNNLEGLRQFRSATKAKNTLALEIMVELLKNEKPNHKWSIREICKGAMLRSQNALDAPWNSHIRRAIDQHNTHIKLSRSCSGRTIETEEFIDEKTSSSQIRTATSKMALENALMQISRWEAEATWYSTENQDLKKIISRLENQLVKTTEALEAIRKNSSGVRGDASAKSAQNVLALPSARLKDNDPS